MSTSLLLGLLRAYVEGDLLARRALLDWLEENGDSRLEAVRREEIDWDKVARSVCPNVWHALPRYRWYVDCARVGSTALPEVVAAVQQARRDWLQVLFPEVAL
jgi:hypothetical protein